MSSSKATGKMTELSEDMQLHLAQRHFEEAYKLAALRDTFYWVLFASATLTVSSMVAFLRGVRPAFWYCAPLFPIAVGNMWLYDRSFGQGPLRIREEASRIIRNEAARFALPVGNRLMTTEQYVETFVWPRRKGPASLTDRNDSSYKIKM